MEDITIYTLEEVAQILKTSIDTIIVDINNGSLHAFRVGTEWRITKENLKSFIEKGGSQVGNNDKVATKIVNLDLKEAVAFKHIWPGGDIEDYPEAFEGLAKNKYGNFEIKIGIGDRYAAGKIRKRVVVFVNGRPTVEFVGIDDFENTKLTMSLITLPNRKRLTARQAIPSEYKSFTIAKYNSLITGPHSMSTMAVLSKIDDYDTMVAHALIRVSYRED